MRLMKSRYIPLIWRLMSSIVETPAAVAWPPIHELGSTTRTLAPILAAWIAAEIPPVPPPAMMMSYELLGWRFREAADEVKMMKTVKTVNKNFLAFKT